MTKKSPENEILAKGNNSCKVGQTRQKSSLICIMLRQIHIPNFKSISQKTGENSSENKIFAKGNNSSKIGSNDTKVELDLYYVKTNP